MTSSSKFESSAQPTPGYNTAIPAEIMTADTVETSIGTLKFFDGVPTKETVESLLGYGKGKQTPSDLHIYSVYRYVVTRPDGQTVLVDMTATSPSNPSSVVRPAARAQNAASIIERSSPSPGPPGLRSAATNVSVRRPAAADRCTRTDRPEGVQMPWRIWRDSSRGLIPKA